MIIFSRISLITGLLVFWLYHLSLLNHLDIVNSATNNPAIFTSKWNHNIVSVDIHSQRVKIRIYLYFFTWIRDNRHLTTLFFPPCGNLIFSLIYLWCRKFDFFPRSLNPVRQTHKLFHTFGVHIITRRGEHILNVTIFPDGFCTQSCAQSHCTNCDETNFLLDKSFAIYNWNGHSRLVNDTWSCNYVAYGNSRADHRLYCINNICVPEMGMTVHGKNGYTDEQRFCNFIIMKAPRSTQNTQSQSSLVW